VTFILDTGSPIVWIPTSGHHYNPTKS